MKIICLGRNLGMGGMERQLAGLASLLHSHGHKVSVVTYRDKADFFGGDLAEKGVERLRFLKRKGEPTLLFEIRLAGLFRRMAPDLVIAYGQGASRKAAVARLFFPHFRLIVSERTANPRINPFDLYKVLLYGLSSQILMTNSYAQAELLSRAFPWIRRKLVTVPNFVDSVLFSPSEAPTPGSQDVSPSPTLPESPAPSARDEDGRGRFTIVTTSRVAPRKNILRYIRAVRLALDRGADFRVLWYGRRTDSDKYCRRCDRLIEKLNLQDRFILLDAVPNPESVYGGADAFCLPSHYEGTSNSLAEALSCGLPVICSNAGDNVRYVSRKNGYVFDSKDTDSIAAAIIGIVGTSADVLGNMKKESRDIVSRELSIEAFDRRIGLLLKTVTETQPCA